MARKKMVPKKRQIFDDGYFFNYENLREECLAEHRRKDPSVESIDDDTLKGYCTAEHILALMRDFQLVDDAVGATPFIGVGDDGRFFVVKSYAFIRAQVLGEHATWAWLCWDENGRLFCEAYDFDARAWGDDSPGIQFEVRQLNKRGIKLLSSLGPDDPVPVEKLFSKRYSDPPRIAERALGCPAEQWEEAVEPERKPGAAADRAKVFLDGRGGSLTGSTDFKIRR